MTDVWKIAYSERISNQILEASAGLDHAFREMWLDMTDGPRLGPGWPELNVILAPHRRREQIREVLRETMPNKTPGTFRRPA